MRSIETSFNYCDPDFGYFSSDEQRWINKIHKLKEKYPDKVTILKEPEDNGGCIYARLPSYTLKIQFKREYTDEQRAEMGKRLNRDQIPETENPLSD